MQTKMELLSPSESRVLASARLAVTASLAALASSTDPGLAAAGGGRDFRLVLKVPGLRRQWIARESGHVTAGGGELAPPGPPSLVLAFFGARSAASLLSGGKGLVLPLPSGPGAFSALAFFKAAASRIPVLLASPDTDPGLRASLLVTAALAGLAEVGSLDPWLADRMHHVPEGLVAVTCPGSFSLGMARDKDGLRFLDREPERPNARLSFRDPGAAVGVFSGARPAVVALAAGEVAIAGLLPLVQGLFAVLDRLGDYLDVKVSAKEKR